MDYLFPGRSLHLRSVSQGEAVSFLLDLIWGTRSDVWAKTKTCTIKSTYFFKKKTLLSYNGKSSTKGSKVCIKHHECA